MALWVVRAGSYGEQQDVAINERVVCHAWNELPDYSSCRTKDDLRALYVRTYPDETERQVVARMNQVWRFAKDIQIGDFVALPLIDEASFAIGRVTGPYEYRKLAPNVMHIRRVEWLKTIPRAAFPKDMLFSMNSALTIFQVSRNDAEARFTKLLTQSVMLPDDTDDEGDDVSEEQPLEELDKSARDEILKFIQANFKGHALARLVDAVLRAQGYKTEVSPPGPDGGVDILAGSGALGFEQPRLCVQVKSGGSAEGQKTFNELLGVVSKFDSQQGLLVSWSGFTNPVKSDARKDFFRIRLWDQGSLVDAVLQNYERFDDVIKADLPLKRIWVLVKEQTD